MAQQNDNLAHSTSGADDVDNAATSNHTEGMDEFVNGISQYEAKIVSFHIPPPPGQAPGQANANPKKPVGTIATQLQFSTVEPPKSRAHMVWRPLLGVLAAAAALSVLLSPRIRQRVVADVSRGKNQALSLIRNPNGVDKDLGGYEGQDSVERAPRRLAGQSADADQAVNDSAACDSLLRSISDGSISMLDRPTITDCYLLRDDLANAEATLRPAISGFRAGLKAPAGATAEAYVTMITVLLKQGKGRAADQLVGSACSQWQPTAACAAKTILMLTRNEPGADGALDFMLSSQVVSGRIKSQLALAGALHSNDSSNSKIMILRIGQALAGAPKSALALTKQIYETRILALLQRGDVVRLKSMAAKALASLKRLDAADLTKIRVISEVANSTNHRQTLTEILNREDVSYRIRGDLDLVEGLGPVILSEHLYDEYRRLLGQSRDTFATRYHALDGAAKRLSILGIRTTMAQGDQRRALAQISTHISLYGRDHLALHLNGVALAASSADQSTQSRAAQELQAALKMKHDWETVYALGTTLVRAGKVNNIGPVLEDFTKLATTKTQKFWLDMLLAEVAIAKSNYLDAQKILGGWRQSQPSRLAPMKLQMQIYVKTGKNFAAESLQEDIIRLMEQESATLADDTASSPLSYMALARRPGA